MDLRDRQLAYLILRLGTGINFLMHGLVRLPKLSQFANGLSESFASTPLPAALVNAFAYALPFAEATAGLLLLTGLFTRWAALGAGLIICTLLFGTTLQENWSTAGSQMVYLLVIYFLLAHRKNNFLSIDKN